MPKRWHRIRCLLRPLALAAILAGCGRPLATTPSNFRPTAAMPAALAPSPRPTARPSSTPAPTLPPLPSATPTPNPANDPVFVGAGDIALCGSDGAEATARLLDGIEGMVFTLGDNAYEAGTPEQFRDCYDPTWGRHKARTRPSPGNHDYGTPGAAGYYDYFGEQAGPERRGYYSFDLGAWHIVSLNSEIAAGPESAQAQWLRDDLAAHPAACTLAYWHKPLFSSGSVHGNDPHMRAIWQILASAGADVVLGGHDHVYERFAPQDADGAADPQGMREFVAGAGGSNLYGIGQVQPNSEVRGTGTFGVLKLTLHATSYDWEFVPVEGGAFSDAGSAACVGLP
ncbi:MAG TPA: metallophosphoesterase [Roseiflexaceae bacterium]|nr:metallophosphoesterase [Roseiflexaceae bacterium]